jgi:hypothetical protein
MNQRCEQWHSGVCACDRPKVVQVLSKTTVDWLNEWKFKRALDAVFRDDNATAHERRLIAALSATFGDCGRFDSYLAEIVDVAVATLIKPTPGSEAKPD